MASLIEAACELTPLAGVLVFLAVWEVVVTS